MATSVMRFRDGWSTEILVVGGGPTGAIAALAAAELGVTVTLVERYGFLGGASTQVLDTFYGFYTPGKAPRKVVGGIPDRVLAELQQRDAMILRTSSYGAGIGVAYDSETLKSVWDDLIVGAGIKVLLHALSLDARLDGERVMGVVVATKAGLMPLGAAVTVDATGDADVAWAAGVPCDIPLPNESLQSLTTTFRLLNVDTERAAQITPAELHELMRTADQSGDYRLPRLDGSLRPTPLPGVVATNLTRVANVDPTEPLEVTHAEMEGRRQSMEYIRFLRDKVPGFETARLANLGVQIGIRESRRIRGEYRLTREDVLGGRKFDDGIACCGAPIEEHHAGNITRWAFLPEGETYDIPWRCLVPQRVQNLIVAGRCLSADHDAHASARSMAPCMAMGQAAGVAAALAVKGGGSLPAVSARDIQAALRSLGALL
jgi:glycine/D-amino acid oxidase-like deaminating enzyme